MSHNPPPHLSGEVTSLIGKFNPKEFGDRTKREKPERPVKEASRKKGMKNEYQ